MKTLLIILTILMVIGCKETDSTENTPTYIDWIGEYFSEPFDCIQYHSGKAYRNTTEGKSYLCDGEEWQLIAEDGAGCSSVGVVHE